MEENTTNTEPTAQTQIQTKVVEIKTEGGSSGIWSSLKNGNFALFLAIAGVASTLFNLYLTSKLAPVAEDITSINQIVKAQDTRIGTLESTDSMYLPRYIATEQQVVGINASLNRIEAAQSRLEDKFDEILTKK